VGVQTSAGEAALMAYRLADTRLYEAKRRVGQRVA
jgi:hypothetical protein